MLLALSHLTIDRASLSRRTHLLLALNSLTIDHAPFSRWSTVPTPSRDTSKVWALITFFPIYCIPGTREELLVDVIAFLFVVWR